MSEMLGFGNAEEWAAFKARNTTFLAALPRLTALANRLLAKPQDFAAPVDRVVHSLTTICLEDFMEILLLCANGYGIAGMKLVRTLYENAVTADYLRQEPGEVDLFLNFYLVAQKKLLDALDRDALQEDLPPDLRALVEGEYQRVKAQFDVERCPKCHARGTNYRWSPLDFVSMARRCDGLDVLLVPAYLDTLQYTHASAAGMIRRLAGDAEHVSYRTAPQRDEAQWALRLAHTIMFPVISSYVKRFAIGDAEPELGSCSDGFMAVWEVSRNESGAD